MQCPKCGGRGMCYATKPEGTVKQRYRKCRICDHRFTTWEEIDERAVREYEAKPKALTHDLFGQVEGKGKDG